MLSPLRGRRQARRWARATGGRRAAAAMADYQLAATELALAHQRAERGVIGPAQFDERSRNLLALMRAARDGFFRQQRASATPPWEWEGYSGFGRNWHGPGTPQG